MTTPPSAAPVPHGGAQAPDTVTPAERERVVQMLGVHFAYDRLSMEAYEDRLERAYRAMSRPQLEALLRDLPAASGEEVASTPSPLLVPASEVPARGIILAAMGGTERKGSWIVPQHLKVWAMAGGASLDLREARFAPGRTVIEVFAFMGGVEIIVPPGVRVETSSTAVFAGGVENEAGDATALSPLQPVIELSGLVIFGGVETKTRLPGETEKERKQRLKREKEARKRLR